MKMRLTFSSKKFLIFVSVTSSSSSYNEGPCGNENSSVTLPAVFAGTPLTIKDSSSSLLCFGLNSNLHGQSSKGSNIGLKHCKMRIRT